MENELKNRIQIIMDSEQLNPGAFAKKIQVNPSAMSHILNGRNKPSMEIITKILKTFPQINSEWLILGEGNFSRQIRQSQPTSLFDTVTDLGEQVSSDFKTFDSAINFPKEEPKPTEQSFVNNVKLGQLPAQAQAIIEKVGVKRIVVYYTNNTYEEFLSNQK